MWYPNLGYPKSENWTISESTVTQRDYFAAKAMMGFLASGKTNKFDIIAEWSYGMADAMLKARESKDE